MTQGYLEWLLCFEGEGVIHLFLPPAVGEEGIADDSGAGEAGVKVESDLVSRITEQINFKPKTAREREVMESCGAMLLALASWEGCRVCPYMLELELVSPLTTTLQPGHIPSGYRASNCRRGGDGEAWQGERDAQPCSCLTHLHLSYPLIVLSFLPPSHAGTRSAPAFFSLLNNLRGSKLIRNEVAATSS